MSFGGSDYDPAMQDAINYAWSRGVLVVAAVGNTGSSSVLYPAAYDHVVGVGSCSLVGGAAAPAIARSSFSAYGAGLDILAPGDYIWGPDQPGYTGANSLVPGYCWWQGTSMSAPFVAAAASMLLRFEPTLSPDEVENLLESSATSVGGDGYNTANGWGALDVLAAYEKLKATYPVLDRPAVSGLTAGATYTDHEFSLSWAPVEGHDVSYVVTGDWSDAPLYSGRGTSVFLTGVPDGVRTVTVSATSLTDWSDASSVSSIVFGVNVTPPAAAPTSLSMGSSAPIVGSGAPVTLSGVLLTANGDSVSDGTITVKGSDDGGVTQQWVGTAQTGADGSWSLTSAPQRDCVYEAGYAGDSSHLASRSSAVTVTVSPAVGATSSITIRTTAVTSRIGKAPILSGWVLPASMIGKNVVVYVMKPGKHFWTYSSYRTVYALGGRAAWQYKYLFKKGMARGTYRFEVAVPASAAGVASRPKTTGIRVK